MRVSVPAELPEDPPALKKIIADLVGQMNTLLDLVAELRRDKFGPKSERLPEGQQILPFYGQVVDDPPPPASTTPPPPPKVTEKKGHGRRVMPANLPRRQVVHDVAADEKACKDCGQALSEIHPEVSCQLDYRPASIEVVENVRKRYACKPCQANVVTAEAPPNPFEKSEAGPGLISHVIVSKYDDHLPLYRQSEIFLRNGVKIARSVLGDWVRQAYELLAPIVAEVKADVLASRVIHADDSPVDMFQSETDRKLKEARLWAYVGDRLHRQVYYEVAPDRKQEWVESFFRGYEGYVQADAAKGYDRLFKRAAGKIREVACHAHNRRYYWKAQDTDKERSLWMLGQIGRLYGVEHEIVELKLDGVDKVRYRRDKAPPILAEIREWLEREVVRVLPKSPIGKAIQYSRGQWDALQVYLEDADLDIDNNEVERVLRGPAVGRGNWLFFGSEEGGKWGAAAYTLIESCKLNDVNPFEYLRDVLVRVSTTPMSAVATLMPRLWKPAEAPVALATS